MSQELFNNSFEQKNLGEELKEMKELYSRRKSLQWRWNNLFEKIQHIEFGYPSDVKFNEQRRYKSDRSFLSPEDKEKYDILNKEQDDVEKERDELDKEILRRRFELGLKHLADINRREDVAWRETGEHIPNPNDPFDVLYSKKWRAKTNDIVAELEISKEVVASFIAGARRVAEEIGDTQMAERTKDWPKERAIDFNVHLSFSVKPRSILQRVNKNLLPGVDMVKCFNSRNEEMDSTEVHLPLSPDANAFPKIREADEEQARDEMVALAKKLEIEGF